MQVRSIGQKTTHGFSMKRQRTKRPDSGSRGGRKTFSGLLDLESGSRALLPVSDRYQLLFELQDLLIGLGQSCAKSVNANLCDANFTFRFVERGVVGVVARQFVCPGMMFREQSLRGNKSCCDRLRGVESLLQGFFRVGFEEAHGNE